METPEIKQDQATSAETPAESKSFINPDGTLKPGWETEYIPQEFQNRPCYKAFKPDLKSIMAHIGHQDIAISRQGKGVFVPGPEASQIEKDHFYKAIGRPDKPEDYKFEIPKEMAEWYEPNPEDVQMFRETMHKVGATPAQFDAAKNLFFEILKRERQNMIKNPMPYLEEIMQYAQPIRKAQAEAELKARWGNAYDVRLLEANKIVDRFIPPGEQREKFALLFGDNPDIADLFATISLQLLSSGTGPDTSSGSPPLSSMNIQQQIDELMANPNYMDGRTNPALHKQLVEKVQALFEIKNKK